MRVALWALLLLVAPRDAGSQTLPSRFYDQASGLTTLSPTQIIQAADGAIVVNTQASAFLFDGQKFVRLGERQGIHGMSTFNAIGLGPGGRFIVGAQGDRLLVAQTGERSGIHPLAFAEVASDGHRFQGFNAMTAYGDGVVVTTTKALAYLDLARAAHPVLAPLPERIAGTADRLSRATSLFGDGHLLWGAMPNGQICVGGGDGVQCWGPQEGLPDEHWGGLVRTPAGEIVARSAYHMVWLEPGTAHIVRIADLPDPSAMYQAVGVTQQNIIVTADGGLLTQTAHGVAVLRGERWEPLALTPSAATSTPLMLDRSGCLWVGIFGAGIRQYFGFGATRSWTAETGLANNLVWGIARLGRQTYVATDGGLNVIDDDLVPRRVFESRPIQSVATGNGATLWLSVGNDRLVSLDPRSGRRQEWALQSITNIHPRPDGTVWVPTGRGLYRLEDHAGVISDPVLSSPVDLTITDMVVDPDGTLWITGNGCLWRKRPDGPLVALVSDWGEQEVNPQVVFHAADGPVWVGTMDGLFRIDVAGDTAAVTHIPNRFLPDPAVMAVLSRRDGSLWVGTCSGIAIEKDGHWSGIDTYDGLIGDDIAQDVLLDDTDQTIWVATSRGLTHILRPDEMLRPHPLAVSILSERVNGQPYRGRQLAYGPARLDLALGVFDNPFSGRLRYRIRMSDTDPQWTELSTGVVGYPSLPSGQHDLLVAAYDPVRHVTSAELHIPIVMAQPWWRRPWAYALAIGLFAGAIWLAMRWRTAYLVAQRRALADQVSSRTRELEARTLELEEARHRLEILAQRDGLTGLLNRRAVRDVFDELVATATSGLSIALIDVDHFKRINDTNGHLGGDAVLVEIARRFERAFVAGEVAGRFGGEEYVVLLPGPPDRAAEKLRAIAREVADRPVFFGIRVIRFTVSGGIADVGPAETWEQVLTRADDALYEAKRAGRDLIIEARRVAVRPEPV